MKKGRYKTNLMKKLKRKSVGHGPISQKVISALRKTINRKVIDISEWKNAKIHADNLEKSVITIFPSWIHYMVFMLMLKTNYLF
jgi:hypothetical protein